MKRTMLVLVVVEEESDPIDTTGELVEEVSRVVPALKPSLAKCGEVVQLAQRRAAGERRP